MPPQRRLTSASRELFGEPEPPTYFPPVGGGRTGFGSYVSPGYAAQAVMEDIELEAQKDALLTRRADSLLRRANAASEMTLLPYTTAAQRSKLGFVPQQVAAAKELLPYETARDRELARTAEDNAVRQRELAPELDAYEQERRDFQRQQMADANPYMDKLQRVHGAGADDLYAYRQFEEMAPADLPARKKQEWAQTQTLNLMRDREAVEAADLMAETDPTYRDLVENVTDAKGRLIGQRIADKADPKRVAEMTLSYRRNLRDQNLRQKKLAEETNYYTKSIGAYDDRIADLQDRLRRAPSASKQALEDQLEEYRGIRDTLDDELRELRGKPVLRKKKAAAKTVEEPAKTEPTKAEGPPRGREANVADFFKGVK